MSTHTPSDPPATAPADAARGGLAAAFAIGALLCGVVGLVALTHPFAELAILFGVLARRRSHDDPRRRGAATAIAAIALGVVALLVFTIIPLAAGGTPQ